IESTEPVAYAVSRPDPLTVFVDLRDVSMGDVSSTIARKGRLAGVTLEQPSAGSVRVRVALAAPSAYKVRSARNVIRIELEPEPAAAAALDVEALAGSAMAVRRAPAPVEDTTVAAATTIDKIHAAHTKTSTVITLAG